MRFSFCTAATVVIASVAASASANLITNGSFEDAGATNFIGWTDTTTTDPVLPGWEFEFTPGNFAFVGVADNHPEEFKTGTYTAYTGQQPGATGQILTASPSRPSATPGLVYNLTFSGRNEAGGDGGIFASIEFFDSSGNFINDGGSTMTYLAGSPGGAFGDFATSGIAPAGAASVGVRFGTGPGSVEQVGNFDNFVLTAVPEPTTFGAFVSMFLFGFASRRVR